VKKQRLVVSAIIVCVLIILVTLPLVTACSKTTTTAAAPPSADKIQIGILACLTGFLSTSDMSDLAIANITADLINEQGGVTIKGKKYQIELIAEDGKSTMDGVTAAANRLVYDKKLKYVLGPAAFFATGATPVTEPAKVLRVGLHSGNSPGEMDSTTPYSFLAGSNGAVGLAYAAIKYLHETYPNIKKVAFVAPDDGTDIYVAPHDKKYLESLGMSLVGDIVLFANETVDYSPIAAKLNQIKDAEAFVQINGMEIQTGNIVKGLRDLGNTKPFAACIPGSLANAVAITGVAGAKDLFTTGLHSSEQNLPPMTKEIIKRAVAKYGPDYSLLLWMPNSMYVLTKVMEAAQSLDPTEIKAKWESMASVDNLYGTAYMCGEQTYGIKNHAVVGLNAISILKDGKVTSGGLLDIGKLP
jgi:branched-chain amino acid transport system substrate-binding protein